MLHGGFVNANVWGDQVKALAPRHTAIVMDSRGHGRSTRNSQPYSYDLMADDVVGLMDALKLSGADVVGWSDGANIALDIAIRHPDRVGKIFEFGPNVSPSGMKDDADKNATVAAVGQQAKEQDQKYSSTPKDFQAFADALMKMWGAAELDGGAAQGDQGSRAGGGRRPR